MDNDVIRLLIELVRRRHFGKYRGVVVDNEDETQRGRLKVRVPAVLGTLEVWAMPCVPYAGADVGFLSLPAPEAGVWVEFEGGDPSFPIWVGCFWADDEAPEDGSPDVKTWRTETLTVRLDDANVELMIAADDGASVTLASDAVTEAGDSTHTVASDGVTTEAGTQKIEVTSASVSVNSGALEVM